MAASRLLVLNAGSSSLKFAAFAGADGEPGLIVRGQVSGIGTAPRFEVSGPDIPAERHDAPAVASLVEAQQVLIAWLEGRGLAVGAFAGIGHRIVHGGTRYVAPVVVDDDVLHDLDQLRALAPLHLPFGLGALTRMRELAPAVPQVACFDTAFHAGQPDVATRLPLPRAYHAAVIAVTASTASITSMWWKSCRAARVSRCRAASWSLISATAPRCAPSRPASASPPPWVIPLPTA